MSVREAELAAIELLDDAWRDRELPVDPFLIAAALGIEVRFAQMPQDVSGSIEMKPGQTPQIRINRGDSLARQRFTCAHEIGHYRKRAEYPANTDFTDYRDTLAGLGVDAKEVFANQFAAALLMPADQVATFHDQGVPVGEMAIRFGTSAQAMELRLRNLSLI